MGSNSSKTCNDTAGPNFDSDGSTFDPRSPTPEIARTPLQGKNGTKHNITKNADLRKTFEGGNGDEKLIHNNPILSAVIKNHLQSYDPRSPTQDFERTPVIIPSKTRILDDTATQICDESLDNLKLADNSVMSITDKDMGELILPKNLCNVFDDLSVGSTVKESEIPLGSSTASTESIENNISNNVCKPSKLLETDFDYVEGDTDKNEELESFSYAESVKKFEIINDDPRSPSLGIDRTPIVISKIPAPNQHNVEEMSDDTLIKVLQCTNAELRQNNKPIEKTPEGLLIYEDDAPNILTPKKTTCNSGSRTPLSCMRNKTDCHIRSKSASTVIDPKSDKGASKISKRVSHIPRLKSLSKPPVMSNESAISIKSSKALVSGDCENTPPPSHRDRWDQDTSIVL